MTKEFSSQDKDNLLHPIEEIGSVSGWQNIEINENGQGLVCLNSSSPRIIVDSQYLSLGYKDANSQQYCRSEVQSRLGVVLTQLPGNLKIKIYDAWRPLELQQAIFNKFLAELRAAHVGLSEDQLVEMCRKFVSLPSSDLVKPSPHYTGGSIDLTLTDINGDELWMGTVFDDFSDKAGTRYFEDDNHITNDLDQLARQNRRLLFQTMRSAGFSNYSEEWWHYDYGNQFWGKVTNSKACYGPIKI